MSGAVMNYDFGPKRHWRRWVWNRIAERLLVPAREALVVYLAGASDFDRGIAITHGFRPENLVAVERDPASLAALRERGVLAVDGDFVSAVTALSMRRRVDVVFGDFCNGLTIDTLQALGMWTPSPNLRRAVFAFNMLRGRDAATNDFRANQQSKHRGLLLVTAHCAAGGLQIAEAAKPGATAEELRLLGLHYARENAKVANPAFDSYRSESGQYFDSVVMRGPMWDIATPRVEAAGEQRFFGAAAADRLKSKKGKAAKGSAAAVMAHRTRRLA